MADYLPIHYEIIVVASLTATDQKTAITALLKKRTFN
jgi:hypothetical protein